MRVGIVGCGYVADYYVSTLGGHPALTLAGVADRSEERLRSFCAHHGVSPYASVGQMLEDPSVDIVVNLTNPASHVDITRAALEAGKHVYSEKPLALRQRDAEALVELAAARGLGLASAPCGVLGETAQTLWKLLRDGRIGKPQLVYAELDDGPKYFPKYRPRISASGAHWPHLDEFRTGCILEHAGYYLSWLVAFFGPARTVT
ncbi:MAG TPA: Gfo/Idh/MocA family oxidoreductase, partial [Polyangiaceae bacterium]|nr:Gfo/Idh/MocA family oxidoreductase [Polyangiaceae bacterium]